MQDRDISSQLQERIEAAFAAGSPQCIRGAGSKNFYGREPAGERIDVSAHRGIVNYEPTELVLSARAGTPLDEIEQTLAAHHQMLPFDPPHFGQGATLGGTIACNLSGPRRAYVGAARDFVLGARVLNGRGDILSFGGEVMKNVAGYDVSRLMAGALGTLGILLQVSVKVLPQPDTEITLIREASADDALATMHAWAQRPYPVSASCFDGESLYVRLSGTARAVASARRILGGATFPQAERFWYRLREQQQGFFTTDKILWRLSIASDCPPMSIDGKWLYEWGGAQRWLVSGASVSRVRQAAADAGGHATMFRGGDRDDVFHPLPAALLAIHRRLKAAFDPKGILNPGRIYRDL